MTDPAGLVTFSAFALAAIAAASGAGLKAWRGWLELRRLDLSGRSEIAGPSGGGRIEIFELRERVRRLEAIATGTER